MVMLTYSIWSTAFSIPHCLILNYHPCDTLVLDAFDLLRICSKNLIIPEHRKSKSDLSRQDITSQDVVNKALLHVGFSYMTQLPLLLIFVQENSSE